MVIHFAYLQHQRQTFWVVSILHKIYSMQIIPIHINSLNHFVEYGHLHPEYTANLVASGEYYHCYWILLKHYHDVIKTTMTSQITSLTTVDSIVYSGEDQRKHPNSASLAFVRGIHR